MIFENISSNKFVLWNVYSLHYVNIRLAAVGNKNKIAYEKHIKREYEILIKIELICYKLIETNSLCHINKKIIIILRQVLFINVFLFF